jgi:hypothetical protein
MGTVIAGSKPASGATVILQNASTGSVERCTCDELGRYEFLVADVGPWRLAALSLRQLTRPRRRSRHEPCELVRIDDNEDLVDEIRSGLDVNCHNGPQSIACDEDESQAAVDWFDSDIT